MIILITGATSSIGEGCARKYAAEGHKLVLNGRDIAEVVYWANSAPAHMQIAEVLVMPTNQATGTIVHREK